MQISVVVGENSTRVPNGFCLPLSLVIAAASRCHNIYQRESERDERERERERFSNKTAHSNFTFL
jgi:hypothetical protein